MSKQHRSILKIAKNLFSSDGFLDITNFKKLQELSIQLQKQVKEEEQNQYSTANLNLLAINERIRLRVMENISQNKDKSFIIQLRESFQKSSFEIVSQIQEKLLDSYYDQSKVSIKPTADEILQLWLSLNNPAHTIYTNNFHEADLPGFFDNLEYEDHLVKSLQDHTFIENTPLLEFIQKPESLHPESIVKQLEYILENWSQFLSDEDINAILLSIDLEREENKTRLAGPGPSEVITYEDYNYDDRNFSSDSDWMPRLVLISKNVPVWLDQLSKKYKKSIETLDQVPNEELDLLKNRGFSGIWLIGIWQRSRASSKIKDATGNFGTIGSAYSIFDYAISPSLGGKAAFDRFKQRMLDRGLKIGADIVANHTGLFSKWIVDHPDWFIQTKELPFPNYSFSKENLSDDPKIELYLEDRYYDASDAAVVFKRVDTKTQDVTYVYHGNDGTNLPWNDTAQLDFLNADLREALIETIVDIAQHVDIIRFDAAMAIAKKHVQRLWYPKPGEGGDIPSRSFFSLPEKSFDQNMPHEFWRQVVDRINSDAPDTLLMAEAFWLMESYFVRTLGMHRVYNSAFMNMLKDEENSKYRQIIKNTLAYNPEILKRFVNYLTTPDEETAIKQFGIQDKYFGICTFMATLPGLPMFGHGQFEGFEEKYGMEYSKGFLDEMENEELIKRHESDIVPLFNKRYLFAESTNFRFYDFINEDQSVNEDVYAYSNRRFNERALIIFNNKFTEISGYIKESVPFVNDEGQATQTESFVKALDFDGAHGFLAAKDRVTGLYFLQRIEDLRDNGFYFKTGAFKYHVFTEFEIINSDLKIWGSVYDIIGSNGIPDLRGVFDEEQQKQSLVTKEILVAEDTELVISEPLDEDNTVVDEIPSAEEPIDSELDDLKVEFSLLKFENDQLRHQNEQLIQELKRLGDQQTNLSKLGGGKLSSVIVQQIADLLAEYSNGLNLRVIAMSLGINMLTTLRHVAFLKKEAMVTIDGSKDEDNPIIKKL